MRYGRLMMTAGWLLAAVLATAVGIAAVGVIGRGLTDPAGEPMSGAEIDRRLASAGDPSRNPSATPSASRSPEPSRAGTRKLFTTPAGTVLARCEEDIAELVTWSPANGYHTREVNRRRGVEAEVTFERGGDDDDDDGERVKVEVTCDNGVPRMELDD